MAFKVTMSVRSALVTSFVCGMVVGGSIAASVLKNKYSKMLSTNVESVKKAYKEKNEFRKEKPVEAREEPIKDVYDRPQPDRITENYSGEIAKASEEQNTDYSKFFDNDVDDADMNPYSEVVNVIESVEKDDKPSAPRVISEDEYYDESDDTPRIILDLYDDGILTDDMHRPIEEIDKIVDPDILQEFIDDESESEMFVKVDSRNCIYCIEKQGETWEHMLDRHPRFREEF